MEHSKAHYRKINIEGYRWGGFEGDTGLHCFQRGNYRDGFAEIKCRESEITDGSLELLIKLGMTR